MLIEVFICVESKREEMSLRKDPLDIGPRVLLMEIFILIDYHLLSNHKYARSSYRQKYMINRISNQMKMKLIN